MKERIISRLHLEQFIKDEILFYSIVIIENQNYYICIGAHFLYFLNENFLMEPIKISLEHIKQLISYNESYSRFGIVLESKNNQTTTVLSTSSTSLEIASNSNSSNVDECIIINLETSNRLQLMKEIQIHYKTNNILKNWNLQCYDLPIITKNVITSNSINLNKQKEEEEENLWKQIQIDSMKKTSGLYKVLQNNSLLNNNENKKLKIEKLVDGYWFLLSDLNFLKINNENSLESGNNHRSSKKIHHFTKIEKKNYFEINFEKNVENSNTLSSSLLSSSNISASEKSKEDFPAKKKDKLTFKIIPIRHSNAPTNHLRTIAHKTMFTKNELKEMLDYNILKDENYFKESGIYLNDKSIYECYHLQIHYTMLQNNLQNNNSLQNDNLQHRMKRVIVCRRKYLPPYASHFQDIIIIHDFEYIIPENDVNHHPSIHKTTNTHNNPMTSPLLNQSEQNNIKQFILNENINLTALNPNHLLDICLQSLNVFPQCFLYDELSIRTKIESLNGDIEFYDWVSLKLNLKPELYPIKLTNNIYDNNLSSNEIQLKKNLDRVDLFMSEIIKLISNNGNQTSTSDSNNDLLFDIEKDLVNNVDSPENTKNINLQKWRSKLAYYLAYYCDGKFSNELTLEVLMEYFCNNVNINNNILQQNQNTTNATTSDANQNNNNSMISNLEQSANISKIISIFNYFLHLRFSDQMYDFQTSLTEMIEMIEQKTDELQYSFFDFDIYNNNKTNNEIYYDEKVQKYEEQLKQDELAKQLQFIMYRQMIMGNYNNNIFLQKKKDSTICLMNTFIFIKLMKLNYFFYVLSPLNFVKLLSNAIHISSMINYDHVYEMCYELLQWLIHCDLKQNYKDQIPHHLLITIRDILSNYTPFLHVLCSLLQYDDDGLLMVVSSILERLTHHYENVRKWLTVNDYIQFIIDHVENVNIRTQQYVTSSLLRILRNCCNTIDKRSIIVKDGEILPIIIHQVLQSSILKNFNNLEEESKFRQDLINSSLETLLVIVQSSSYNDIGGEDEDELMSELIVNENAINILIQLLFISVQRMSKAKQMVLPKYFGNLLSLLLALSSYEYFRGVAISIILQGGVLSSNDDNNLHHHNHTNSPSIHINGNSQLNSNNTLITLLIQSINLILQFMNQSKKRMHNIFDDNTSELKYYILLILSTLLMLSTNSRAVGEMKENMLELLMKEIEFKLALPHSGNNNGNSNEEHNSFNVSTNNQDLMGDSDNQTKLLVSVISHLNIRLGMKNDNRRMSFRR
ncbi:hypothetical protein ABK040_015829 [Willaertia magna]